MRNFFIILLSLITIQAQSQQCTPDMTFAASASVEGTNDFGFIAQVGITGQLSRLSLHAGVRHGFIPDSLKSNGTGDFAFFPRAELDIRIIDGLHIAAGMSRKPDISVITYARLGEKVAIQFRGGWDGDLLLSIGFKKLIYQN